MEATLTKPKCKRCNGELSEDLKRKCLVCLTCYPNALNPPIAPLPVKDTKKYLDVKMTEEMVREICRDEMRNWHVQEPPVTAEETEVLTATEAIEQMKLDKKPEEDTGARARPDPGGFDEMTPAQVKAAREGRLDDEPLDWRAEAKKLGVPLNKPTGGARKKIEVLADIKAKNEAV